MTINDRQSLVFQEFSTFLIAIIDPYSVIIADDEETGTGYTEKGTICDSDDRSKYCLWFDSQLLHFLTLER